MSNPHATVNWWDNGVGLSFHTRLTLGADSTDDQGWTTVETVLIRLNTSYTPSGRFPVYSNYSLLNDRGVETRIGYDAVVCVQKYEPWIIEAYNASVGSPSVLRVVGKGYGDTSPLPGGNIRGAPIVGTRSLNTTGRGPAFFLAHDNMLNQFVKDNARNSDYVPSLTVGPVLPLYSIFILIDTFRRLFRSPRVEDLGDTSNSLQIDSPSFAHGPMPLTFSHTSQGLDLSLHSYTRIRH